jgi:hypothetical protein
VSNAIYRGLLVYGRRSNRKGAYSLIEVSVPSAMLVDEQQWRRANEQLSRNQLMATRNAKHYYALRGLVKCMHCHWSYGGSRYSKLGGPERVYLCRGRQQGRRNGYALDCNGKMVNAVEIEDAVWRDVLSFLKPPRATLGEMTERLVVQENENKEAGKQLAAAKAALARTAVERQRVVTQYRRGVIDQDTLDLQLAEIEKEAQALQAQVRDAESLAAHVAGVKTKIEDAGAALHELRKHLDRGVTDEVKRTLIETFVDGKVEIETTGEGRDRKAVAHVRYHFPRPDLQAVARTSRCTRHSTH